MTSPAESTPKITLPRRTLAPGLAETARLGLAGGYGLAAADVERAFHELGVNYFFVTPRMKGPMEGVRRLIRAGYRDRMVIAGGASIPMGASVPREWARFAKASGVDVVDVFHLYWVQAEWYVTGKTWPAMERLKTEGKVKALAISCHDRKLARALVDKLDLDVLMIRYNAAHRGAEREIFSTLPEKRPGIVTYTATRWGKLLEPLGELGPMTPDECYRFALQHARVGVVLSGAASFGELRQNAEGILRGPIPETRMEEIKKFGDAVRSKITGKIAFGGA